MTPNVIGLIKLNVKINCGTPKYVMSPPTRPLNVGSLCRFTLNLPDSVYGTFHFPIIPITEEVSVLVKSFRPSPSEPLPKNFESYIHLKDLLV